jgi:hypothetical protein
MTSIDDCETMGEAVVDQQVQLNPTELTNGAIVWVYHGPTCVDLSHLDETWPIRKHEVINRGRKYLYVSVTAIRERDRWRLSDYGRVIWSSFQDAREASLKCVAELIAELEKRPAGYWAYSLKSEKMTDLLKLQRRLLSITEQSALTEPC